MCSIATDAQWQEFLTNPDCAFTICPDCHHVNNERDKEFCEHCHCDINESNAMRRCNGAVS